jgi:hypothetical protein
MTIEQALQSLKPGALWRILGESSYENLEWVDEQQTKPTKKQVLDEVTRLQLEYQAKEYQRQRALEYPGLGDQLDMLWHAIDAGTLNKTSDFYKTIKAVKDAYPKSE